MNGSLAADIDNPFVLTAAGTLSLVDQSVDQASLTATIPGGVSFDGNLKKASTMSSRSTGTSGVRSTRMASMLKAERKSKSEWRRRPATCTSIRPGSRLAATLRSSGVP